MKIIAILDSQQNRSRVDWVYGLMYRAGVEGGFLIPCFEEVANFSSWLSSNESKLDLIILDYDLGEMEPTAYSIIPAIPEGVPVIIQTSNFNAGLRMLAKLDAEKPDSDIAYCSFEDRESLLPIIRDFLGIGDAKELV